MKTFLLCVLSVLCVSTLTGCHTAAQHHETLDPRRETVAFNPARNVLLTRQMKESLTSILENHGFTVSANPPAALLVETEVEHGVTSLTVYVRLVRDGHLCLLARSENYGWGNWVAPDASRDNLTQSAFMAFDRELGKACVLKRPTF